MYLEAGWSDFLLLPPDCNAASHGDASAALLHEFVKPVFFQKVASLARTWANTIYLDVTSVCDVGAGTGRAIFELERQFRRLNRLVLLEPSLIFSEWAELLLASNEPLPDMPLVTSAGGLKMVSPHHRPPPIPRASDRINVLNRRLEDCRDLGGFDLVTCLNVIDRHKRPQDVVSRIAEMMNPGGFLVLSSPFDFSESSTPDVECWIEDLNTLFDDSWEIVGKDELFYEFRPFNRKWTRYSSQVVASKLLN